MAKDNKAGTQERAENFLREQQKVLDDAMAEMLRRIEERISGKQKAPHYNELTGKQLERLAHLSEELAEAQQIIGKIMRHGLFSFHPDNLNVSNLELLERELGDVNAAVLLLQECTPLNSARMMKASKDKFHRVKQWLHY